MISMRISCSGLDDGADEGSTTGISCCARSTTLNHSFRVFVMNIEPQVPRSIAIRRFTRSLAGQCQNRHEGSRTTPLTNPRTPLLTHTRSPPRTLSTLTHPSTHNPLSSAHLLVVPRLPPLSPAGVTHRPPRKKYTLVRLPSMISPLGL